MTIGSSPDNKLLDRVLMEVRAALPELNSRPATETLLQKRVGALLSTADLLPAQPARRPMTVLVAEIRGFDALAEQYTATRVSELWQRILTSLQPAIERHNGTIYQVAGTVLTVVFGAPKALDDHAVQALACAVELQQAMMRCDRHSAALELPVLYMAIGVNSGEVLIAPTEIDGYRGYALVGHVPALAARIAAQSLRGQVLIGESCYRLMSDFILVGESSGMRVRGRHLPVTTYELLGTSRPRPLAVPRREFRSGPRVLVQMPCYFNEVGDDQRSATQHCGRVVDLGYRGLRMISPVPLPPSAEIKMSLSLQLLGNRTSDVYARIVSAAAEQHGYRCGIEFTDIDIAGRQAVKQFVDSQIGAV